MIYNVSNVATVSVLSCNITGSYDTKADVNEFKNKDSSVRISDFSCWLFFRSSVSQKLTLAFELLMVVQEPKPELALTHFCPIIS